MLANVWYDFDIGGVKPYVGGGIGWANAQADGSIAGGTTAAFDFEEDGFAWQIGAGVNFDIAPSMKLGLGYRYFVGPDVPVALSSSTATGDLDNENHTALVNLTFGM